MFFKIALASLLFYLLPAKAFGGSIYTTVFNVFKSAKTEKLLVLSAADGRIYKTSFNEETQKNLKDMIGQVVRLEYTERGPEAYITDIKVALANEVDKSVMDLNHFQYDQLRSFAPTDLKTPENVTKVFNSMINNADLTLSQCFKRAHMWAYDMWSKSGIFSEKVFIFYTKRYQILEEFNWWFHVAPMVRAAGVEYVLDKTFMKKPTTIEAWKNQFIKSGKITCPVIDKFQDFENNHWNRLCYLMKVPMYHFRPLDIENRDKKGEEKNYWVLEELQDARRAFRNWKKVYEGLDSGQRTRTH